MSGRRIMTIFHYVGLSYVGATVLLALALQTFA